MVEMITISRMEYDRLVEAAADWADVVSGERTMADIAAYRGEGVPSEYIKRIIDGESPLRVYRDYRGLTQAALAEAAKVNRVQIADIEARRKTGSVATLRKLADALKLTIDDLV